MIADLVMRQGFGRGVERHPLATIADAATFLLVWIATPAILAWFWFRAASYHELWLTAYHAGLFLVSGFASLVSLRVLVEASRPEACRWRRRLVGLAKRLTGWRAALSVTLVLAWLSVERTLGWLLPVDVTFSNEKLLGLPKFNWTVADIPTLVAQIDLPRAQITRRPTDWQDYAEWSDAFRREWRDREGIGAGDALSPEQRSELNRAMSAKRARMIDALAPPDFSGRRLNRADLTKAFAAGAILEGADLRNTILVDATLKGADLRGARLEGANLGDARLEGANLVEARLGGADCTGATLRGAPVQSAMLTCDNLAQPHLEGAIGNDETVLPKGLWVHDCWPETSEWLGAFAERWQGRATEALIREAFGCDGRQPRKIHGTWDPPAEEQERR